MRFVLEVLLGFAIAFLATVLHRFSYSNDHHRFGILIDAGSTGSRIHVYEFKVNAADGGDYELLHDTFMQVEPGLSELVRVKGMPEACDSLRPLLDKAVEVVPADLQRRIHVHVLATAGLRLLESDKVDALLKELKNLINNEYSFEAGKIDVMDGKDEALFAWMTINYLMSRQNAQAKSKKRAVIEMGGGSVQVIFPIEQSNSKDLFKHEIHPNNSHYYETALVNGEYVLFYQHSYLGYGLMEARKLALKNLTPFSLEEVEALVFKHPCLPKDKDMNLKDEGTVIVSHLHSKYIDFDGKTTIDDLSLVYDECTGLVKSLFTEQECPTEKCSSISGTHQPDMGHIDEIFIFSYFYDRTRELLGLDSAVHEQEHLSEWTLNDLKHLSRLVCYLSYHPTMSGEESMHLIESLSNHLVKHFDSAQALITHVLSKIEQNDHLCFDVRFIHEILVALVGNVDDKKVVIEKRIEGIEVGWCLGWIISWLQQNPEGYEESNN